MSPDSWWCSSSKGWDGGRASSSCVCMCAFVHVCTCVCVGVREHVHAQACTHLYALSAFWDQGGPKQKVPFSKGPKVQKHATVNLHSAEQVLAAYILICSWFRPSPSADCPDLIIFTRPSPTCGCDRGLSECRRINSSVS